jgi:hypothetical protein
MVRGKLTGVCENVEIWQGRFYHDDVCALGNITLLSAIVNRGSVDGEGRTYDGTASKALGTRWKLIAFTVAKRGGASRSVSGVQKNSHKNVSGGRSDFT